MEKIRKLKALSEKISGKVWHVSQLMFLLTVGLTCQVSANVSAQVVHLQAREHTLQAIFNEVEKQAGLLTFSVITNWICAAPFVFKKRFHHKGIVSGYLRRDSTAGGDYKQLCSDSPRSPRPSANATERTDSYRASHR